MTGMLAQVTTRRRKWKASPGACTGQPSGGHSSPAADRSSAGLAVMLRLTEALKSQQHVTRIHLDHSNWSVHTVTVV